MSSTASVETVTRKVHNLLQLNAGETLTQSRKIGVPDPDYAYARLLPSYDHDFKLAPLEPFEHVDPGHAALHDADPRSFLKGASVSNLTPRFGSEVSGLQLSSLGVKDKRQVPVHPQRISAYSAASSPCTSLSEES